MIYLLLALAGSCAMSWEFKLADSLRADTGRAAFYNYLAAMAGLWFYTILSGDAASRIASCTAGMAALAVVLGIAMMVNLLALNISTAENGVNSTTFFNRIGFLVSLILSAVIWREVPSVTQVIGILCLIGGLRVMIKSMESGSANNRRGARLLAVLALSSGMVVFFNAVYGRLYSDDMQTFFIAVVFTGTFFMSACVLAGQRGTAPAAASKRAGVLVGLLLGVSNILTTLFTLKSYAALPISVVAPVMSAGNMIFAALLGHFVYREPFQKRTALALALAAVSLILVNL